ncbi:hypothetical protein LXL04_028437 [Taraxacum kok-saghyz]
MYITYDLIERVIPVNVKNVGYQGDDDGFDSVEQRRNLGQGKCRGVRIEAIIGGDRFVCSGRSRRRQICFEEEKQRFSHTGILESLERRLKSFSSKQLKNINRWGNLQIDVTLKNRKIPITLTLWDTLDTHEGNTLQGLTESWPLIFAMNVKVTTFYGISLTTRVGSSIIINPPVTKEL